MKRQSNLTINPQIIAAPRKASPSANNSSMISLRLIKRRAPRWMPSTLTTMLAVRKKGAVMRFCRIRTRVRGLSKKITQINKDIPPNNKRNQHPYKTKSSHWFPHQKKVALWKKKMIKGKIRRKTDLRVPTIRNLPTSKTKVSVKQIGVRIVNRIATISEVKHPIRLSKASKTATNKSTIAVETPTKSSEAQLAPRQRLKTNLVLSISTTEQTFWVLTKSKMSALQTTNPNSRTTFKHNMTEKKNTHGCQMKHWRSQTSTRSCTMRYLILCSGLNRQMTWESRESIL